MLDLDDPRVREEIVDYLYGHVTGWDGFDRDDCASGLIAALRAIPTVPGVPVRASLDGLQWFACDGLYSPTHIAYPVPATDRPTTFKPCPEACHDYPNCPCCHVPDSPATDPGRTPVADGIRILRLRDGKFDGWYSDKWTGDMEEYVAIPEPVAARLVDPDDAKVRERAIHAVQILRDLTPGEREMVADAVLAAIREVKA